MTDTPRTDALCSTHCWGPGKHAFTQISEHYQQLKAHARTLERELADVNAAHDGAQETMRAVLKATQAAGVHAGSLAYGVEVLHRQRDEERKRFADLFDETHGTPCEQIRHQQELEDRVQYAEGFETALRNLLAQVDKFVEQHGEGDFYTGEARAALAKSPGEQKMTRLLCVYCGSHYGVSSDGAFSHPSGSCPLKGHVRLDALAKNPSPSASDTGAKTASHAPADAPGPVGLGPRITGPGLIDGCPVCGYLRCECPSESVPVGGGREEGSAPVGCFLAMDVLQSDLYHELEPAAKGECDYLVARYQASLRGEAMPGEGVLQADIGRKDVNERDRIELLERQLASARTLIDAWIPTMTSVRGPGAMAAIVNRFLAWPLPKDFGPDAGITFKPSEHPHGWPVGTNLFTADQAKAMFEHVLGGAVPEGEGRVRGGGEERTKTDWQEPTL